MMRLVNGRLVRALVATGAAGALLGSATTRACDQDARAAAQQAAVASQPPAGGAGMRTFTDPNTGEILDHAPAGAAAPAPQPRSVPVMRESAGTTPAGGVKMEGDFRMTVRTRTDESGKTVTDCVPAAGKQE